MADWVLVDNTEILKVSNESKDSLNELKDCLEKKKLEISKMSNIEQVLAMTSVFQPKRTEKLMKDREKIVERLKMLNKAVEVLKSQIGNA